MKDFRQFNLPETLLESLNGMGILTPTPIQNATIPVALNGQDILASAQTGSGKTIAYLIPLIIKLTAHPKDIALILTPTREIATQVHRVLNQLLGKKALFKTALLIGGAPMFKQISALKKRPQLIVGTPGRVYDHLSRTTLSLKETRFLVVDEADRMLDMGFGVQLDKIAEHLPSHRQTLMFSATVPVNIEKLAKKYLRTPQRISIDTSMQAAPKIKQEVLHTTHAEKFSQLLRQLDERKDSIIIFVKTRHGAARLSKELRNHGHSCNAIHGNLSQRCRDTVIHGFRNHVHRILVATDIAARGLDIPHIKHVINYDLPQCDDDYIHRIGRTGRADAEGNSLCFVLPEDHRKWKSIAKLMGLKEPTKQSSKPQISKKRRPSRRPSKRVHRFA